METILRQLNLIQSKLNPGELTLLEIKDILGKVPSIKDFEKFTTFKTEKYQRNSVLSFSSFELVCICWLPGQASSIHSHGVTSGGMRVVSGKIFEEEYETPQGKVERKRIHQVGDCGWVTPNTLHRVGNASDVPAVTIHLYSPPFKTVAVQLITLDVMAS
jgi:predicted metal-dependent enzyme (double-stranded beta helix superfamily)